ncbi:hypothetical protein RI129_000860 [Pyrocoelia pectoralis]|uniref:Uncharacterized protein n=1 Tax=Pyrocoelia pectoralis TaxID=417401 RepID=A0AAN7VTI3_9COLE
MAPQRYKKNYEKIIAATSTPNTTSNRLSASKNSKSISPISSDRQESVLESDSSSSSESSELTDHSFQPYSLSPRPRETDNNRRHYHKLRQAPDASIMATFFILGFVIVGVFSYCLANMSKDEQDCDFISMKEIQEKFPTQSQYTFDAIVSGVNEVKIFNKPSIFLFLYKSDARQTVDNLVQVLARYASNNLNEDCKANPIILTISSLNTVNSKTDYGDIIARYKPILEEKTVMIVKNLDKIPGALAQAFHSICDEYSPLVPKSVIIFTIEVKDTSNKYKSDYEHVEHILRESWSDLDDDTFYPLLTRITSMVLQVQR